MRQCIAFEVAVNRTHPTYKKLNKREKFHCWLEHVREAGHYFAQAETTYFLCTVRWQTEFVKLFFFF